MKKIARIFLSVIVMLCCSLTAMAQSMQVKGTVTDKQYGDPIIGATVKEVGNESNAVITDFDGNFTLSVANGAQLQFTYVGMQTLVLPASAQMNVVMEDEENSLQEVVVTGYTTQRKADLTGSYAELPITEKEVALPLRSLKKVDGKTFNLKNVYFVAFYTATATTIRISEVSLVKATVPDPIDEVPEDEESNVVIYDASGVKTQQLKKGVNIILKSDGTTRKVIGTGRK